MRQAKSTESLPTRFGVWIVCLTFTCCAGAQSTYTPPPESATLLVGIPLSAGKAAGKQFTDRFNECDHHDTCDGSPLKHGCEKDPSQNTTLLQLPGGVIFYDAKMGVDADGSPLSVKNAGPTDQPNTSLRYPLPGSPSVNSDAVPYIVIPLGGFDKALGISLGDIAAVVFKNRLVFALVADFGPKCKIGEGSIQLHEALGHPVCTQRDSKGECTKLRDVGINKNVLYFIFPGSAKTISEGLTPENVNDRLATQGPRLLDALKGSH